VSQKTERRRHEALARETASWTSWAVGPWWTNGFMAMLLDEPSTGTPMRLDYECLCSNTDRSYHADQLDRLCVFVDSYEPAPGFADTLAKTLTTCMDCRGNKYCEIDRSVERVGEDSGLVSYAARIPGETSPRAWLAVQKPYVEAIERHARPDRWAWSQLPPSPDGTVRAPVVWALRGERNQGVGLIMPMTCPGSAIEMTPHEQDDRAVTVAGTEER
jgi:hypothetical protein